MEHKIIIVGSGIVGLTTAVVLHSRGYDVEIYHDPKSLYASDKAGAHFRPVSETDGLLRQLEKDTFHIFDQFVDLNVGIQYADGIEYHDSDFSTGWMPYTFLEQKNGKLGIKYKQFIINVPLHLDYLRNLLKSRGIIFKKYKIENFKDFQEEHSDDLIIMCTGLGSAILFKDPHVFPIRGQTVLVDAPYIRTSYFTMKHDNPYYVIPRGDGTVILGGTFTPNSWNTNVSQKIANRIIKNCKSLFGIEFDKVLSHQVGLRPGRTTVRIEREGNIIYNYGHGISGWQTSYGSAFEVLRLVQETDPVQTVKLDEPFFTRLNPLVNAKL
eukprot:NODE_687_length_4732_cov_0.694582.p3 type:complete len:325 gc:universal NODE_687_length_4732_cov_0.694582:1396-422(-)